MIQFPLDLWHLFTEDKAPHFIPQLLYFTRIRRLSKTFGQCKESFLFLFLCFQTLLHQLDQYAIVTEASLLGEALDLLRQSRRQGHASPNLFGW